MAKSVLPSLFSYILLALLIFLAIRQSSQQFKKIRDKLLETDNITSEETIKDIEMQGPYFAAFRLQYTPQMYNHEETQVLRKISGSYRRKQCLQKKLTFKSTRCYARSRTARLSCSRRSCGLMGCTKLKGIAGPKMNNSLRLNFVGCVFS
ncbi:hypothetical protein TrLO_g5179 [Triparma laevis f. longispina]|uniref:Uncharacterized protein n=1 Tax=Triparma laevis f. longispina TaxID=1714387 RepID=A0A9W7FG16_9STRA|nr:hypothetical protein TrLO_g5179 [Triparma laevis f. longispina]